jgi:alkanesulfonate monooxygenase SsuD/methylene tetrahydromethanopterin reductase-like flavin-dependent oxidoreductase (luciferase family)
MCEMRFDLSGCGAGLDESTRSLLDLGPLAESLGYDGLWINEEHFGQGSRVCLSPILLATASGSPPSMRNSVSATSCW